MSVPHSKGAARKSLFRRESRLFAKQETHPAKAVRANRKPRSPRDGRPHHLTDAVIDQFGKNTILVPEDDTHFIVLLPVELSPPFFAWIATFGRGAKILSPAAAVDKMRDFIDRCADMYKDDGEK